MVCPSSRKRAYERSDSSMGSSASRSLTSRIRKSWNGEYHSRSQWVWGTMATVRFDMGAEPRCGAGRRCLSTVARVDLDPAVVLAGRPRADGALRVFAAGLVALERAAVGVQRPAVAGADQLVARDQ